MTGRPVDPTVVIEGVNSTQVQLVWNFTAAPSSSFILFIQRRTPTGSQNTNVASRTRISGSSSVFTVSDPDYEANLPATLVIKDVTRNDEFVYSISVLDLDAAGRQEIFDEVTVDVLCKSDLVFVLLFSSILDLRPIPATTVAINLYKSQLLIFSICDFLIICLSNATGGLLP